MAVPQESPLYLTPEYIREHGWSRETSDQTEAFFEAVLEEAVRLLGEEGRASSLRISLEMTPVEIQPDDSPDQDGDLVVPLMGPCRPGELHLPGLVLGCICLRVEKAYVAPE